MGSVELLTREGEIEIAKRIEDGLQAHDAWRSPPARPRSPRSCAWPTGSRAGEMQIDEVVDGFVDRRRGRRLRRPRKTSTSSTRKTTTTATAAARR
ncbi:MAG: hypothetical protein MZW92_70005 [Comamonadaceae bacterium]|nr:hypothetical protein [Comamonadaceae bacterium]